GCLLDVLARRAALPLRRGHQRRPFRRGGTLAPFFRASESPMAMACLRLLARPWRPFPALSVPLFDLRTALATDRLAPLPYFPPRVDLRFFISALLSENLRSRGPMRVGLERGFVATLRHDADL